MKPSRIYMSNDHGAGALVASVLDIWGSGEAASIPKGSDVAEWARRSGMDWAQPGRVWYAGRDPRGVPVYFCGVPGNREIVVRALHYVIQLAGGSPLDWEIICLPVSAPRVRSWSRFLKAYPRLLRRFGEGV